MGAAGESDTEELPAASLDDSALASITAEFHSLVGYGAASAGVLPASAALEEEHVLPTTFELVESVDDRVTNALWAALLSQPLSSGPHSGEAGGVASQGFSESKEAADIFDASSSAVSDSKHGDATLAAASASLGLGSVAVAAAHADEASTELREVLAQLQAEALAVAAGARPRVALRTIGAGLGEGTPAAEGASQPAGGHREESDDAVDFRRQRSALKGGAAAGSGSVRPASAQVRPGTAGGPAAGTSSAAQGPRPVMATAEPAAPAPLPTLAPEDVVDSGDAHTDLFDFILKARAVEASVQQAVSSGRPSTARSSQADAGGTKVESGGTAGESKNADRGDSDDELNTTAETDLTADGDLAAAVAAATAPDGLEDPYAGLSTADRVARMTAAELDALDYTHSTGRRQWVSTASDGSDDDDDADDSAGGGYGHGNSGGFAGQYGYDYSAAMYAGEHDGSSDDDDDEEEGDAAAAGARAGSGRAGAGSDGKRTAGRPVATRYGGTAGRAKAASVVATDGGSTRRPGGPATGGAHAAAGLSAVRGTEDVDEENDEEEEEEDVGFSTRIKPLADPSARVFRRALVEVTDGTAAALTLEAKLKRAADAASAEASAATHAAGRTPAASSSSASAVRPSHAASGIAPTGVSGPSGQPSSATSTPASSAAARQQFAVNGASVRAARYKPGSGEGAGAEAVPVWDASAAATSSYYTRGSGAGVGAGAGAGVPRWE